MLWHSPFPGLNRHWHGQGQRQRNWTWLSGSATTEGYVNASYPSAPGTSGLGEMGSRMSGQAWSTSSTTNTGTNVDGARVRHWVFGGWGVDERGNQGYLNDMWFYEYQQQSVS